QSIHTPSAAGSTAGVSWAHASQTAGVGGIRRHAMTDMPLGPPCDQMFGDLYANICSVPVVKTEHRASPEEMGGKAAKPVPVRGRGSVPGRTMSQSPGLWRRVVPYRLGCRAAAGAVPEAAETAASGWSRPAGTRRRQRRK